MIQGVVNAAYEAVVTLPLQDPEGRTRNVEAVIDTGYSGFLTLPPGLVDELGLPFAYMGQAFLANDAVVDFDVHDVTLLWDGQPRRIKADATGSTPLVGMAMLDRHDLNVEVVNGGRVVNSGQAIALLGRRALHGRAQPHLEDGAIYRPRRPTRLDKIKNFHGAVQAGGVSLDVRQPEITYVRMATEMKYVRRSWFHSLMSRLVLRRQGSCTPSLEMLSTERGVPIRQTNLAPDGLEFSEDVSEGRWVEEGLFDSHVSTVRYLLPNGFPAYARVFHPA